jgi:DNA-binding CsgD family transcriptional regulator
MQPPPEARRLTDLIYASLLGEGPWQDFLDALSRLLPNGRAFLFFHDAATGLGPFPLSSGVDADVLDLYGSYYSSKNPWMHGACTRPVSRVVRAESMLPREQVLRTEFYCDWMRPQDIVSGIGVTVLRENHCNFLLSILSADGDDAVYDRAIMSMQALVPHLERAFNMYRRDQSSVFGLFCGLGATESLRIGTIAIGAGGKVQSVSPAAAEMLEAVDVILIDCTGRFRCRAPDVADCIDTMLASWMRREQVLPPQNFLLHRHGRLPPIRLTVIAPPGETEAKFFRGPQCLVLLEDPFRGIDVAVEDFGIAFGLTPAEKRVVAGLAEGYALSEIAARAGTSPGTVRAQLKQVFAKMGTSRQGELIRQICLFAGTLLYRPARVASLTGAEGT